MVILQELCELYVKSCKHCVFCWTCILMWCFQITKLEHNFFMCFFYSLHVSGSHVPIIRRIIVHYFCSLHVSGSHVPIIRRIIVYYFCSLHVSGSLVPIIRRIIIFFLFCTCFGQLCVHHQENNLFFLFSTCFGQLCFHHMENYCNYSFLNMFRAALCPSSGELLYFFYSVLVSGSHVSIIRRIIVCFSISTCFEQPCSHHRQNYCINATPVLCDWNKRMV